LPFIASIISFITVSPSPCTQISALVSSNALLGYSEQCGPPIIIFNFGFVSFIILINSFIVSKLKLKTVIPTICTFFTSSMSFSLLYSSDE